MELKAPTTTISPSDYMALSMRTAKWFPQQQMSMVHAALLLMSEAGELAEVSIRCDLWLPMKDHGHDYKKATLEELGDFAWSLAYTITLHMPEIEREIGTNAVWPIEKEWDKILDGSTIHTADLHANDLLASSRVATEELLPWVASEYGSLIKSHAVYNKPMDYVALYRSLVLMGRALARMVSAMNISRCEMYRHNLIKLKHRYPDKYSDELAIARLDKIQPGSDVISEGGTPD